IGDIRRHHKANDLIQRANENSENERHDEAIRLLTEATALCPEEAVAYFKRAQSYLEKGSVPEAKRDSHTFKRLLTDESSREAHEAATRLDSEISERSAEILKFGVEVPRMMREAMEFLKQKNYEQCETRIRDAIRRCPKAGKA